MTDSLQRKKDILMLTEDGLYRLLLISRKPVAKQFRKWVFKLIKEVRLSNDNNHKSLVEENKKLKLQIEMTKQSKEKAGIIYIAGNAKEKDTNIYKVGETLNEKKRLSSMNTCEPDGCFIIYQSFETINRKLAEKLIHTFLDNQNYKYNKEFYNIELSKLIKVVRCFTTFVNQMKHDDIFDSITDITEKLQTNIKTTVQDIVYQDSQNISTTNNTNSFNNTTNNTTNNNNVNINISINTSNLKFFDEDIYKQFINDRLSSKDGCKTLTNIMINAFENYINTHNISPKQHIKGGSASSYFFALPFKKEFIQVIQDAFELKQKKLKGFPNEANLKNPKGFEGIACKTDDIAIV